MGADTQPAAADRDARAAPDDRMCPSAQPDMEGAVAFGVVGGTPTEPVVGYLAELQPVTPELLALTRPVRPDEVFRFGAPCAKGGCRHYDGARCKLGAKIVRSVPAAVSRLPACRLRPNCRWFSEQGGAACMRCPVVVTTHYAPADALAAAADPETPAA